MTEEFEIDDDLHPIDVTPQGEMFCPHCEHFIDWHMGLPWDGGPNREWRFRCRCGCTVDMPHDGVLRLLDPDTFEPCGQQPSDTSVKADHSGSTEQVQP